MNIDTSSSSGNGLLVSECNAQGDNGNNRLVSSSGGEGSGMKRAYETGALDKNIGGQTIKKRKVKAVKVEMTDKAVVSEIKARWASSETEDRHAGEKQAVHYLSSKDLGAKGIYNIALFILGQKEGVDDKLRSLAVDALHYLARNKKKKDMDSNVRLDAARKLWELEKHSKGFEYIASDKTLDVETRKEAAGIFFCYEAEKNEETDRRWAGYDSIMKDSEVAEIHKIGVAEIYTTLKDSGGCALIIEHIKDSKTVEDAINVLEASRDFDSLLAAAKNPKLKLEKRLKIAHRAYDVGSKKSKCSGYSAILKDKSVSDSDKVKSIREILEKRLCDKRVCNMCSSHLSRIIKESKDHALLVEAASTFIAYIDDTVETDAYVALCDIVAHEGIEDDVRANAAITLHADKILIEKIPEHGFNALSRYADNAPLEDKVLIAEIFFKHAKADRRFEVHQKIAADSSLEMQDRLKAAIRLLIDAFDISFQRVLEEKKKLPADFLSHEGIEKIIRVHEAFVLAMEEDRYVDALDACLEGLASWETSRFMVSRMEDILKAVRNAGRNDWGDHIDELLSVIKAKMEPSDAFRNYRLLAKEIFEEVLKEQKKSKDVDVVCLQRYLKDPKYSSWFHSWVQFSEITDVTWKGMKEQLADLAYYVYADKERKEIVKQKGLIIKCIADFENENSHVLEADQLRPRVRAILRHIKNQKLGVDEFSNLKPVVQAHLRTILNVLAQGGEGCSDASASALERAELEALAFKYQDKLEDLLSIGTVMVKRNVLIAEATRPEYGENMEEYRKSLIMYRDFADIGYGQQGDGRMDYDRKEFVGNMPSFNTIFKGFLSIDADSLVNDLMGWSIVYKKFLCRALGYEHLLPAERKSLESALEKAYEVLAKDEEGAKVMLTEKLKELKIPDKARPAMLEVAFDEKYAGTFSDGKDISLDVYVKKSAALVQDVANAAELPDSILRAELKKRGYIISREDISDTLPPHLDPNEEVTFQLDFEMEHPRPQDDPVVTTE